MLNVSKAMTAGAVEDYFQEGGHDYYIDARNPPGIWGGKLAKEFGLTGEVQKEHFDRLAEGYHPLTGEDLVLRRTENRRSANDITISAPKPLSLLYLETKDDRLLKAFVESCDWIMDQMEPDAATRVRAGGADHDWRTGNWAYAGWLQFDSRPDDKTAMPVIQIHRHHTVFNLTKDKEAERITALQIGKVKENADLWMPLFHNELARRVRELGYGITREPETGIVGFGIAGILSPAI
jgi:conjugative relaxase-like TrwC/TraI family protein